MLELKIFFVAQWVLLSDIELLAQLAPWGGQVSPETGRLRHFFNSKHWSSLLSNRHCRATVWHQCEEHKRLPPCLTLRHSKRKNIHLWAFSNWWKSARLHDGKLWNWHAFIAIPWKTLKLKRFHSDSSKKLWNWNALPVFPRITLKLKRFHSDSSKNFEIETLS